MAVDCGILIGDFCRRVRIVFYIFILFYFFGGGAMLKSKPTKIKDYSDTELRIRITNGRHGYHHWNAVMKKENGD